LTGASQNGLLTVHLESLFDRFPWLYAFCRDHLFRDDTGRIAASLWTAGVPPADSCLLELGCGPGFYARRLGDTFGHLDVTGVDRSESQLGRARMLAAAGSLVNCSFEKGDARALSAPDASFDAVVISRLFVILSEPERVISEAHRVLKPGGRLFVAEPRSALRAMRMLAGLEALFAGRIRDYREPNGVCVLTGGEFDDLVGSQAWRAVRCWQDLWYQYAVCEKR
jgi:ubiquinone/menaquinone biosynthesis C-methylase UbiE